MSLVNSEPTSPTSAPLVENEEFSGGSTPPLASIDDIMSRESIDEVMMSEVMKLENIKYQSGELSDDRAEVSTEEKIDSSHSHDNMNEIFALFRVYFVYFFGLIVDTYFNYNFWNINIRIIRDTFYFSLYDTGFNIFSLSAIFVFLLPLVIVICLPSSCLYLCKQGYFLQSLSYGICWISFALSLIPNIEARLFFESIYFIVFCFHFMVQLSPSQTQNLLRHRRFIDATVISFFYVAILRWVYIGYIPSYVSGWFAALNIFFGFLCTLYLLFEEIFLRLCCPKTWDSTNDQSKSGTLNVAKELYESVTPSKSITERITSILLWRFRSQRSIITRLPITNEERFLCIRLYAFEVLIGIFSVFSFLIFALGLSTVFQIVTHFVLPPLSLPVWAGRESYWDGLFTILSLFLGIGFSIISRPNSNIEDFQEDELKYAMEEASQHEREDDGGGGGGDNDGEDGGGVTSPTSKRRKYNGWTLQNVFCSPIIFLGFLFVLLSIFGLLSYAFNLNFVFWSGNLCIVFVPTMFEFYLGESVHFQFLQIHDVLDCPFYIYHLLKRLVSNILSNYDGGIRHDHNESISNINKSSYAFRGPAIFLGCGYFFFVIILLSSISVWVYQMFPGFGDIFGGKTYLVYILVVMFLAISTLSVCINRCILLLRYRLFVGSRFMSCCSFRMIGFLTKSVFVPRVVEYELLENILVFERMSRMELLLATKAHERKQKTSMSEKEIEMIYQEFQKSDEDDDSDNLLEEEEEEEGGGGEINVVVTDDDDEEETTDDDAEEEGEEEEENVQSNIIIEKSQIEEQEEVINVEGLDIDDDDDDELEDEEMKRPIEEDQKLRRIDDDDLLEEEEEEDDDVDDDDLEEEEEEEKKKGDLKNKKKVDPNNNNNNNNETTPIITKEEEEYDGKIRKFVVLPKEEFVQVFQACCSCFVFRSIPRFVNFASFCVLLPAFIFLFIGMISFPFQHSESTYHEGKFYRLATFNVFHGFMLNGLDNGPQIANDFLKKQKIDFCGFQETCTARPETGYQDIIKYYGIKSGSRNYIQGKESRESTIGVALVTRLPVGEVKDEMFKHEEGGLDRMFLYSTVEMNGTVVNIITTHFDLVDEIKISQAKQLIEFLENNELSEPGSDLPIIMMGDFNSNPNLTSIEVFKRNGFKDAYFEVTGRHDITSQKGDSEGGCIDYIFYRGSQLIPINAFVYRDQDHGLDRSSDHYPVVVDFKVLQSS